MLHNALPPVGRLVQLTEYVSKIARSRNGEISVLLFFLKILQHLRQNAVGKLDSSSQYDDKCVGVNVTKRGEEVKSKDSFFLTFRLKLESLRRKVTVLCVRLPCFMQAKIVIFSESEQSKMLSLTGCWHCFKLSGL